jgi:polyhydroxyalkanoate synthesis regulator phasin
MQQLCDLNHKQIQEFSEKVSLRKSDLEVHEEKIAILTERINQLE